MDTREMPEKVRSGELSAEEAQAFFSREPFEELGYARLDTHREIRSGFSEVICRSGKPDEYLVSIFRKIRETDRMELPFCLAGKDA